MRKTKAAEAKKVEADRLQAFLQEMLKEEENKYCADCEAKQPRWASWNIGVFLCIRCAGLHRNLGVHVSKVKSVTLDSWTPDQIQSMRVMGNAKARAVYECELPSMFRRPQTDQSLEAFIRAKYETKRYLMKDWVPPRVDAGDLPPSATSTAKKATAPSANVAQHQTNTSDKDDNLFGPFATATAADPPPPVDTEQNHHQQELIDVFSQPADNVASIGGDLFGFGGGGDAQPTATNSTAPIGKAQNILELIDFSATASQPAQPEQENHNDQLQQMLTTAQAPPAFDQQAKSDAKMSTNEILALFGTKR
ncbi:hypothetical protein niasHT_032340 [Heterodera trifolii]|uniref:Arf-GAP domain-containing protein n=1 Tax=Heterodera trifolii TaxID=157864 RepID=A0ABD2HYJ0_9BILA